MIKNIIDTLIEKTIDEYNKKKIIDNVLNDIINKIKFNNHIKKEIFEINIKKKENYIETKKSLDNKQIYKLNCKKIFIIISLSTFIGSLIIKYI